MALAVTFWDKELKMPIRLSRHKYKQLQIAVLERDGFTCQYCGRHTEASPHHRRYRSQGGDDSLENLITLCGPLENDCHRKLHDHKISLNNERKI